MCIFFIYPLVSQPEPFRSVTAKRLCASAQIHVANHSRHNGGAGPSSFGNGAGLLEMPVGVSPPAGLTDNAPDPQALWTCHPAAPNWPHPVGSFTAIQTKSEDLVRLCTMVSCPVCGEVRSADTMAAHYRGHHFGTGAVECQWEGCDKTLQFTSLTRHIEQQHLKVTMRHCPYCHREDTCYPGAPLHNAKDCDLRDTARRGEKSSREERARCPMWCRAWTLPENLPEYQLYGKGRAVITGPARSP